MPKMSTLALAAAALVVAPSAAQAATVSRTQALHRLDGSLRDLAAGVVPGAGPVRAALPRVSGGRVAVDVYATGDLDSGARALRRLGMRVSAISRRAPQRMVEGELPVDQLVGAARLSGTRAVVPVV